MATYHCPLCANKYSTEDRHEYALHVAECAGAAAQNKPASKPIKDYDEVSANAAPAKEVQPISSGMGRRPSLGVPPNMLRRGSITAPLTTIFPGRKVVMSGGDPDFLTGFSSKFSPDSKLFAVGCGDGVIRVYEPDSGKLYKTLHAAVIDKAPVTAISWRPPQKDSKHKYVLIAAYTNGSVVRWALGDANKKPELMYSVAEKDNALLAVNFRADGERFVTGGADYAVRVYDEATKECVRSWGGKDNKHHGGRFHSNQVFCAKWSRHDYNTLITGGWDNTVKMWDVRQPQPAMSIFGPHICGESLDINAQKHLLAGSFRNKNPLEVYDLQNGKLLTGIEWSASGAEKGQGMYGTQVYTASYSKDESMIVAGGTHKNECRVWRSPTLGNADYERVGVLPMEGSVYSADFSGDGNYMVASGGVSTVQLFSIIKGR